MTRDEARKLLGGYATGSLTEAEQAALYAAALEDQDLFEELAGEQELKEILEEPGARERLLRALDREPALAWWSRPWPWTAAAVTVAIAIIIVVVQRTPPPPPQKIAQVVKPAEPVAAPPPPAPAAPAKRKAAPAPVKAAPPAPSVDAIAEVRADKAEPQPLPRPAAVGGVSAFAPAARQAEPLAINAVRQFALSYTVRADGVLEIVPAAQGFLSVMAGTSSLFPSTAVPAGMPVRVQIPAAATSLSIGFYAVQGAATAPVRLDQTSGTVTDQDAPNGKILIQLSLTPRTQ